MSGTVQDAVADMQQEGVSVTMEAGGVSATLDDPRKVCERAAEEFGAQVDPNTDPWPHEKGEPVEYVTASVARQIGERLIAGIVRLRHLGPREIHYLYRRKKSWASKGRTVHGKLKRPTGLLRSYADADFIVLLNRSSWASFNPMQRVALVYHELRHADAEGKTRGHDFEGFFDELRIFGTRTYREWNALAEAADKGAGYTHQYSLSLLDPA